MNEGRNMCEFNKKCVLNACDEKSITYEELIYSVGSKASDLTFKAATPVTFKEFPTYKYIMRKGGFSDNEAPELLRNLIDEIHCSL